MARKRPRIQRKRRTREHVIADLGVHHVEGPILRCGFTAERVVHDYGVDLLMTTYKANGELEGGFVMLQLKATDHLKRMADGTAILFRVERRDLLAWQEETYPVYLIVYDAQADVAYWLYVQARFPNRASLGTARTVTVRLPAANVLNEDAVRRFAAAKAAVRAQARGVKHHD